MEEPTRDRAYHPAIYRNIRLHQSSASEAASGVGIAAQRQALADSAGIGGLVVGEVFADEAISGRRMGNRRVSVCERLGKRRKANTR
jgi:hypothetical protein